MKEAIPHSEGPGRMLSGVLPQMPSLEFTKAPWREVARLVEASDRTGLLEAVLSLMESAGLDCPHVALEDAREGGLGIAAHRGVPETLHEKVLENLVGASAGLPPKMPLSLPDGLQHRIAPIGQGEELLGLVGWLGSGEEGARELGEIEALIQAALERVQRSAKHKRRSSQREAVRRAVLAVGEARDLGSMLQAIAERARILTGAESVAVRGRGAGSEEDVWIVRGASSVSAPRPELWEHRIAIRHQGRQLAELRLREAVEGKRPTEQDLSLGRLFADHLGALVASASAKSRLMREVSVHSRNVRWLASVVEHLPVATLLIWPTQDGHSTWLNRRAKTLLGSEGEASLEALEPLVLSEEGRPFSPQAHPLARVLRGEKIHGQEVQILAGDEVEHRFALFHGDTISADETCGVGVIALEDVSAFKTLERMREQWASLITHDLRQPLTSILGFSSLLAQKEDLDPSIRKKIGMISGAARRLVRISRDLLDASLVDARQLGLEPARVDLRRLASSLVNELSRESAGLPIRLEVASDLATIRADPIRIEQVLENLLSNARKYGRRDTEVVLQIERVGDELHVRVRNRCEGFDDADLERIFNRFYRGKNALRAAAPGMGLGLYICRALIEAHGGRIWAETTAEEEIAFTFSLPA